MNCRAEHANHGTSGERHDWERDDGVYLCVEALPPPVPGSTTMWIGVMPYTSPRRRIAQLRAQMSERHT